MPYSDPEKQKQYMREWVQKRRQDWLDKNGPCAICGSTEQLEVDHKDRHQKVEHRVWSWTEEKRNIELAKCWVLCHYHHVQKSVEYNDYNKAPSHGTDNMYDKHRCRCDLCRAHKSVRNAKRYKTASVIQRQNLTLPT